MNSKEERVVILRNSLGLKQGEFSKKIGIPQTTLSTIEHRKSPLQERHIKLICLTFGANEEWLRYGTGEMFCKSLPDGLYPDKREFLDIYSQLYPKNQETVLKYANMLLKDQIEEQQTLTGNAALPEREDTITTSVKNPDITIKKRPCPAENEAGGAAG
jgi:transcriptional regulator with XRE-family HTH domain